jgi:Na+-transporting NADH:ubiquinone oxidoreductase subunit NqrE
MSSKICSVKVKKKTNQISDLFLASCTFILCSIAVYFLYGCILNFQHEADVIIIIEKNCALLSTHFFSVSRIYYILPVVVFNFFSKTISGFDLL